MSDVVNFIERFQMHGNYQRKQPLPLAGSVSDEAFYFLYIINIFLIVL